MQQCCWDLAANGEFEEAYEYLELGLRIRHFAMRFHVLEVESDRKESPFREFGMEKRHERGLHSLSGAVGKDDGGVVGPGFGL